MPSAPVFKSRKGSGKVSLVNRETLKSELDKGIGIFDARTAAEFTGDDLRRLLNEAGFKAREAVVTRCDGGGRAALAAIAALQAGYDDVKAYYLSFSDWAKDGSCPIVKD